MRPPVSLVDGKPRGSLDVADRGLLYGDGLFETIRVENGRPCLWAAHMARLGLGAERLGMPAPDVVLLRTEADRLSAEAGDGVLRITLTRGVGQRGYRPPSPCLPTRIVTLYPGSGRSDRRVSERDGVRLTVCRMQLAEQPRLAGIKHLNRLEQVLARAEWDDPEIVDGIMTDSSGRAVCGTMSNFFVLDDSGLRTPRVDRCGVAGTVRALVMARAPSLGLPVREADMGLEELTQARALFITNALLGVLPAAALDARHYDPREIPRELIEAVGQAALQSESET
jgi:4-amino-4-deoxychorismate lyase